jgi:hypothetical protein
MNKIIEGEVILRDHDYYGGSMKAEWQTAGDGEYDWHLYWQAYQGGNVAISLSHEEALQLADKIYEVSGRDLGFRQLQALAARQERIRNLEDTLHAEHFRRMKLEAAMRVALQEMDINKMKVYLDQILNEEWS